MSSTSTKCKIRPTGWDEDVIAHVDDETWEARWYEPETGLSWTFPHDTYTVIEIYSDEPAGPPEVHLCQCETLLLINRGCLCGGR